jgi:autotransporter-associated beta strand protein
MMLKLTASGGVQTLSRRLTLALAAAILAVAVSIRSVATALTGALAKSCSFSVLRKLGCALLAGVFLAIAATAKAADTNETIWNGGSSNWAITTNWSAGTGTTNGTVPSATVSAEFNSAFTNQPNLPGSETTEGIWVTGSGNTGASDVTTISATTGTLAITGGATLDGVANAGILLDGTGNNSLTITAPIGLSAATTFDVNNAGALTLTGGTGGLIIATGNTLTLGGSNSSGNIIINSATTNTTGAITVNGSGTVTLSGNNLNTGVTTLTTGTLIATNSAGALGAGTLSLGGGILDLTNTAGSSLSFGRNTTVTANTQITTDVLTGGSGAGNTYTLGTLSVAGKTLTIQGSPNVTSGTAGITFGNVTQTASGNVFTVNNPVNGGTTLFTLGAVSGNADSFTVNGTGNTAITGVIGTTTGGVTMTGTGTLTLSAANTYTGATTLGTTTGMGAGTVQIFSATGATTSNILATNSTLVMGGGTLTIQGNNSNSVSQQTGNITFYNGLDTINLVAGTGGNNVALGLGQLVSGATAAQINITGISSTNTLTTLNLNSSLGILGLGTGGADVVVNGSSWATSAATALTGVASSSSGNVLTVSSGAPANGTQVAFTTIPTASGLTANLTYYVVGSNGSTSFQVATTLGGTAVTLVTSTGNGTADLAGALTGLANGSYTATTSTTTGGAGTTTNVDVVTNTTAGAGLNAGTLRFNDTGEAANTANTIAMGANLLNIDSTTNNASGILVTNAVGNANSTISGTNGILMNQNRNTNIFNYDSTGAANGYGLVLNIPLTQNNNGSALEIAGPGLTTLGGSTTNATYNGTTYVSGGALSISSNGNLGAATVGGNGTPTPTLNGAGLDLNGTILQTTATMTLDGTAAAGAANSMLRPVVIGAQGATFATGGNNLTINGPMSQVSGTGALPGALTLGTSISGLAETGTLTLSGANTLTGNTGINGGTLAVAAGPGPAAQAVSALGMQTSATFVSGATSITVGSSAGVVAGQLMLGTGIPIGDTVASVTNSTTLVLNVATTATSGGSYQIYANAPTTVTAFAAGAGTITVGSAANAKVGEAVIGTGILNGTIITAINGNVLTLSQPTSAASSATTSYTFGGNNQLTVASANNIEGGQTIAAASGMSGTVTGVNSANDVVTLSAANSNMTTGITAATFGGAWQSLGTGAVTIANVANTNLSLLSPASGTGTTTIASLSGGGTNGGNVILGPSTVLSTGGNNSSTTFGGVISGSGALTKTGTGIFTLAGANTYSGATTVNGGTLQMGASDTSALGNGNGTLAVNAGTAGATLDLNGNSLTVGALSGTSSGSGSTALSGLITSSTSGTPTLTVNNNPATGGGGTGTTYAGVIQNGSATVGLALATTNTGTLTLTGANTYGGGTTVSGGMLALGANNTLPSTSAINVNGGNLNLANFTDSVGAVTLTSGTITGTTGVLTGTSYATQSGTVSGILGGANVGLTQSTAGTTILSGVNTYTGATTINGGTLALGVSSAINSSSALTVNSTGTFNLTSYNDTLSAVHLLGGSITGSGGTLTDNSAYDVESGSISAILAGSSGLTQSSAGTTTLSGVNTYTGGTTISGGTLNINADAALGSTSSNNVTFTGNSTLQAGGSFSESSSRGIAINSGVTATIDTNNYLPTIAGAIANGTGTGAVTVTNSAGSSGSLTISGTSNSYTGATTINNNAVLNLTGSLGNTAMTINTGGALTGSGNQSTTGIIGGAVSNSAGGGAITLNAGSNSLTVNGLTLGGGTGYSNGNAAGGYTTLNYTFGSGSNIETLDVGNAGMSAPATLAVNAGGVYVAMSGTGTVGDDYTLAQFSNSSIPTLSTFSLLSGTAGDDSQHFGAQTYTLTYVSGAAGIEDLQLDVTGTPTPGMAYFTGNQGTVWNTINGSSTSWSTDLAGQNDAGNTPGVVTDVVLNANTQTGTVSTTLGGNTTINSLKVNGNGTNTIAADGSTLTINAAAINGDTQGVAITVGNAANAFEIDTPIIMGGSGANQTWTNASANSFLVTGTVTGTAAASSTQTLTLANTGSGGTTISGVISDTNTGTGALTAVIVNNSGSGVTTLSGASTFTGGFTLTAGDVVLGNAEGLGGGASGGTVALNGTQLDIAGYSPTIASLSGSSTITDSGSAATLTVDAGNYSGAINNAGGAISLTKATSGTLTLNGVNSYTGATTITAGTLQVNGSLAAGSTVSVATAGTLSGTGTVNGNATMTGNGIISFGTGGNIAGTLGVTGGNWNGVGTVSGQMTSSSGTFTIGNADNLTATTGLNVTGGSIAAGNSSSTITGSINYTSSTASTFGGVIAGSGSTVTMNSANTTLTLSGANTYGGATSVTAGALSLSGSLSGSNVSTSGTGVVTESSAGVIAGASSTFAQGSSGISVLAGANTYAGGTTLAAGDLKVGAAQTTASGPLGAVGSETAPISFTGGTLQFSSSNQFDYSPYFSTAASQPIKIDTNGQSVTFATALQGPGATLTLNDTNGTAGTLSLTGSNTYTGNTTITAGTLTIGAAGTLGSGSYAANISNSATFNYNSSATQSLSGNISGPGALTDGGAGALTLSGSNTYSGVTTVSGTLVVSANAGNTSGGVTTALSNNSSEVLLAPSSTLELLGNTTNTIFRPATAAANSTTNGIYESGSGSAAYNFSAGDTDGGNTTGKTLILANFGLFGPAAGSLQTFNFAVNNNYTLQVGSGASGTGALDNINSVTVNSTTAGGTLSIPGGFAQQHTNSYAFTFGGAGNINVGAIAQSATLSAEPVTSNSTGTVTLSGTSTYTGATSVTAGTFILTGSLAGTNPNTNGYSTGTAITVSNAAIFTETSTGAMGSTDSFTDNSSATATLGGANTYTGATSVTASALSLTGSVTGSNVATSGTGVVTESSTGVIAGASATLTQGSSGTSTLAGTNTYAGGTNINGGVLALGSSGAIGSSGTISFGGGTLQYSASNTTDYSARFSAAGNQPIKIDTNGRAVTFATALQGSGTSLTLNDTNATKGTLTLTAANTYTGATNINAGTLSINAAAAIADTASISLGVPSTSSGILLYTGSGDTISQNISALGNGGDTIENTGSGLLTLSGTLAKNGTTLTLEGAANGITVSGDITGANANSDLVVNGGITNLTGSNTYNGPTDILNGGTLNANAASAIPSNSPVNLDVIGSGSSTLALGASQSAASLNGSITTLSTVNLGTSNLALTGSGSAIYGGTISDGGSGSLTMSGTGSQTLTGANTYQGGTTITSGTLRGNGASAFGSGAVTINGGNIAVGDGVTATAQTLTTSGGENWNGGGGYAPRIFATSVNNFPLNDADDLTTGAVTLGATDGTPFTITAIGTAGSLDGNVSYQWQVATISSITGYSDNSSTLPPSGQTEVVATAGQTGTQFALNVPSTLFGANGDAEVGTPVLELIGTGSGYDLDIAYSYNAAPEPGTVMLVLAGVMPMLAGRRRRRNGADR